MLCIFLLLLSCTTPPTPKWTTFRGRESPTPLYRILVPEGWTAHPPEPTSLSDTRNPLLTLSHGQITGVIHNFPYLTIPPTAQIERWKEQFDPLAPESLSVNPAHFAGFVGLFFEAEGFIHDQPTKMVAWGLQLGKSHSPPGETASPLTLKFTGPPSEVDALRTTLLSIATSCELIEELPSPW